MLKALVVTFHLSFYHSTKCVTYFQSKRREESITTPSLLLEYNDQVFMLLANFRHPKSGKCIKFSRLLIITIFLTLKKCLCNIEFSIHCCTGTLYSISHQSYTSYSIGNESFLFNNRNRTIHMLHYFVTDATENHFLKCI